MTNQFIQIALAAVNVTPKRKLHSDDRHVPAVYSMMIQDGFSSSIVAQAALDLFHSRCPVKILDDFQFVVFSPTSGRVLFEGDSHDRYTKAHLGKDLQRIGDRLPNFYSVQVEAIGDDDDVSELGTVQVVADNQDDARSKALGLLWDARLDSASCSPRYQVESIEACDLLDDGSEAEAAGEAKFERLAQIAEEIKNAEVAWARAWADMGNYEAAESHAQILKTTAQLNSVIEGFVDEIALITNNGDPQIRQCFAPTKWGEVWFSGSGSPSAFLSQVARHKSFNSDIWFRRDRAGAFKAQLALANPLSSVVSVQEAAQAINLGQVPHVNSACANRSYNSPSLLEKALLDSGILEPYDRQYKDRISSVRDFAFVVHGANEQGMPTQTFNFWPIKTAANHIVRSPFGAGEADTAGKIEVDQPRPRAS